MQTLFISCSAADAGLAESVARILEGAGYVVTLPQRDVAGRPFLAQHQSALEAGTRVVALVSETSAADDYCTALWHNIAARDAASGGAGPVVLRLDTCALPAVLARAAAVDVARTADAHAMADAVLRAIGGLPLPVPAAAGGGSGAVTRTLLYAQVAGVAERWERRAVAMPDAMRRCEAIVRFAVTSAGGVVVKTPGDAFRAAFARPHDAVAAAIALHRALAAEDFSAVDGLNVRAAIHTGAVQERGTTLVGPAVERVQRVAAAGAAGQVLVSAAAAALLGERMPDDAVLCDLGTLRLGDNGPPERVRGLVAPGLACDFPPLAANGGANNLPPDLTPLVGRAATIAELEALIAKHRLVTLAGVGGLGKTRTALAVAARCIGARADGVWFIDLAPLTDESYVVPEIAAVLGIREDGDLPLLPGVIAHVKSKEQLLVIDNCEHVLATVRDVAEALVRACPRISILATSRELLGAGGEVAYRLPSLDCAPADAELTAAEAGAFEAIALFDARARAADARFMLTDENCAVVARICRRLDGIPLAIELAAARVALLTVATIDAKLSERFRLLAGGRRSALPRQQTMRALLDWSYDLLDADAQRLIRRLSIFSGGWTLEAAAAVCGEPDGDELTMLDALSSLADKSLVVVDSGGDANRFRFLETVRAYALERARGDAERHLLEGRRADFFAAFAGERTGTADIVAWVQRIDGEVENVRDVLTWALEAGNAPELGARIATALGRFWSTRLPREGLRWLDLAQTRLGPDADPALLAAVATATAAMLPHGSGERFAAAERALSVSRDAADPACLTQALAGFGEQLSAVGRQTEAHAMFEEALASARSIRSDWDAARALAGLTTLAVDRGDRSVARTFGEEAISLFTALDAIDGVAYVSIALGESEFFAGNTARARELVSGARAAYGAVGNIRSSAGAAVYLAALALSVDDIPAARAHARDVLALLATDRHPMFMNEAIGHLGHVATRSGDPERGALLYGYTEAAWRNITLQLTGCARECRERYAAALLATFGAPEFALRRAAGADLTETRALAIALRV